MFLILVWNYFLCFDTKKITNNLIFTKKDTNTLYWRWDTLDYKKFCSEVLDADTKIRFAAVYDEWAALVAGGLREGIDSLLSEKSQQELVNLSIFDWKARRDMSKKLGKVTYTLAEYENVKRFSFYLGDDHLLLVSAEKDDDTNNVVEKVIDLYYKNQ